MRLALAVLGSIAVLAAGCGGDDDESADKPDTQKQAAPAPSGKGSTLALAADPSGDLAFDKKTLNAKAGKTTIDFTNDSQVPHAVEVEGNGVEEETKTVTGAKANLSVDLKPGTYTFYCPVGNHEQAGMKGTLTVK